MQQVVLLAHELVLVDVIKLVAGLELVAAQAALEAVDVKDLVVLSAPDEVVREQALMAAGAFGSEAAVEVVTAEQLALAAEALLGEWLAAVPTLDARLVPGAVEHDAEEAVADRLLATGA